MENLSLFLNRFWRKVYGQLLALTENFKCAEKTQTYKHLFIQNLVVFSVCLTISSFFPLTKCELNPYFQGVKIILKRSRVSLSVLSETWGAVCAVVAWGESEWGVT